MFRTVNRKIRTVNIFLWCGTSFEVRSTGFYVVEPTSKPGGRGVEWNGGSILLGLRVEGRGNRTIGY